MQGILGHPLFKGSFCALWEHALSVRGHGLSVLEWLNGFRGCGSWLCLVFDFADRFGCFGVGYTCSGL